MSVRWPFTARNPPLLVGTSRKARLNYVPLSDAAILGRLDSISGIGDQLQIGHTIPGLPASAVTVFISGQFLCANVGAFLSLRSHGATISSLSTVCYDVTNPGIISGLMAITPGLANQFDLIVQVTGGQAWGLSYLILGYHEGAA